MTTTTQTPGTAPAAQRRRGRTTTRAVRTHSRYAPWVMVLPALVWLSVFSLYPALNTVVLSFTNVRVLSGGEFSGLANYQNMLSDDQLGAAIINTVLYMLICVPLLTLLPLLLALLVEKPLRGLAIFRTIFYFPVIASAVVVALIWQWMLDERGLVNQLLITAGIVQHAIPFLTGRWLLIFSAISLTAWKGLGYYMIIYLAALANVDRSLHEAAAVDGAARVRRFLHVTIPGVRGMMLLVAILSPCRPCGSSPSCTSWAVRRVG